MADLDYPVERLCPTEAKHLARVADCWLEDTTEHHNQCQLRDCAWCDAFDELHLDTTLGLIHYERHHLCPGVKAQP